MTKGNGVKSGRLANGAVLKVDGQSERWQKEREVRKSEIGVKIREYEEKERERRERFEREAVAAERREREAEIEKWERERERMRKRKTLRGREREREQRKPPSGYRDPHEALKSAIPRKVKEEKRREIKALMNCIAFAPSQTDLPGVTATTVSEEERDSRKERNKTGRETDNSSSSDATSDITEVTPRSSSSGCSSMSKQSACLEKAETPRQVTEHNKTESELRGPGEKTQMRREEDEDGGGEGEAKSKKSGGKGRGADDKARGEQEKRREVGVEEPELEPDVEAEEMKYLQDAFEDLDLDEETSDFASSIISGLSEERRAKSNRKNMSFTNEQLREIERVNLILLKKIMNHRKPRAKAQSQPAVVRRTSAAINRARMDEKIERENKILLKKLQSAKGTTGTLPRKKSYC